jgi:quinol monooxygenase YgiN
MSGTVVIVSYRSLPGQSERAESEIRALVENVVASEPECGGITILQESVDPTRITLIENWSSQETFLGPHMEQPHIKDFIQGAAEFLAGPPEISFWHSIGSG